MGHAGLVIGLEVSRLARNSSDWHRLLEICAFTDTLILSEPAFNSINRYVVDHGACPTVRKHIGAISDKTGRAAEVLNSPLGSLRSIVSLSGADGP